MASKKSNPVWERKAPATAKHHGLSKSKKASAKARAKRAGRPYPNLVDNMRAASSGKSGAKKKSSGRKKSAPGKKAKAKKSAARKKSPARKKSAPVKKSSGRP